MAQRTKYDEACESVYLSALAFITLVASCDPVLIPVAWAWRLAELKTATDATKITRFYCSACSRVRPLEMAVDKGNGTYCSDCAPGIGVGA